MSLLTIVRALARDVGFAVPNAVVGSSDRTLIEALEICNQSGEELARRVDWGALTNATTLSGDGTNQKFTLPTYFSRVAQGFGVLSSTGVVRPLTRAEWNMAATEGVPRYFLLEGQGITLWPYLASAQDATVTYQTKAWCSNGTDEFMADDETSLIDEDIFLKCVIVRWRRQKGMDYADHEAEYEAAISDYARFDDRSRV